MDTKFSRSRKLLLVLCLCAVWSGGCFTKKRPAAHLPDITFAHPVVPSAAANNTLGEAPDIVLETAMMPPHLAAPRSAPSRPHVAPAPPAEPSPAEKPVEPIILPDLTAAQLDAAKAETQHSLDLADSNLSQAQGKQMNAAQEDVASKVRGFMESAREAMRTGDWVRAKNQAKKAEVLSQQLAGNH
jgi:hypothetical protein